MENIGCGSASSQSGNFQGWRAPKSSSFLYHQDVVLKIQVNPKGYPGGIVEGRAQKNGGIERGRRQKKFRAMFQRRPEYKRLEFRWHEREKEGLLGWGFQSNIGTLIPTFLSSRPPASPAAIFKNRHIYRQLATSSTNGPYQGLYLSSELPLSQC